MNKELKRKKSKFGIFKINKHPASSKDDSIEIKNKIVTEKEIVLSSTGLKNSIAHSVIEKPVEIKDKKIIEKLTKETELVIKIVSEQLKPDMEISIKNHFDAMRNNLLNEIKDIRTMIEQGKILEQPHIDPAQAVPPQNMPKINGADNNQTRQNPPQNSSPVQQKPIIDPTIMDGLLKLLPEYMKQRSQPDPVMVQIKELMMKKFVNDMGRSDTQGTALTNYLIKRLMKTDPDLFSTEDIPNTLSG